MRILHSLNDIRFALEREIAGALNEPFLTTRVEISEHTLEEDVYSVKGSFKVIPFFSYVAKRRGKFEVKLDQSLKVLQMKITNDPKIGH